jgi:hypothetical protein
MPILEAPQIFEELKPLWKGAVAVSRSHIQQGRFQRSLAFVAAGSSLISGLEVTYEHYKGSYGNRMMYSPVVLSVFLTAGATAAIWNRRAAQTWMRWLSVATLADGIIGFGFHVRGIQRKPNGWQFPLTNIIMGPPIFAPLLFGTAAYLGLMASYLRPEGSEGADEAPAPAGWRRDLQEGKFQKHMSAVTALWTLFSGFEAWYSHFKSRFRLGAQWIPVAVAPLQLAAASAAVVSSTAAERWLPATSAVTAVSGAVGFFYHTRGILRRPGGRKHWLYNILYGPPVFAPLLFSACGALGILASLLRREK